MQGKLDSAAQAATARQLMEQALDATGHPEAKLAPVVKPVAAPSFAAQPVVAGLHPPTLGEQLKLRKL